MREAAAFFPPPEAGEGTLRSRGGEGSAASGTVAPLSRPSLTRGPPSPAEGGGRSRPRFFPTVQSLPCASI
ncbi:hypothetical protein FV230_21105 [Methylobacterium sp. WL6]|nr:hypothetical protein FV230_21105 [Methylobacterium sp. WL6]